MPTHDDLASWQAIHDLITAGAQAQDRHDWDFYGNTFSPNARYVHPKGEIRGREAIVARSVAALEPLDASQHLVGSIVVHVDADRAHATAYFVGQHVRAAAPGDSLFVVAGPYDDELARVNGIWQITQRTQTYSWRQGNPDVIVRSSSVPRDH